MKKWFLIRGFSLTAHMRRSSSLKFAKYFTWHPINFLPLIEISGYGVNNECFVCHTFLRCGMRFVIWVNRRVPYGFFPFSRRMKIAIAHLVHNTKFLFSSFLALPCAPRAGVSLFTIAWCSSAPWTSLQNMWFMRKILKIYLQLICCEISVAPENTERRRSEFEGKRKSVKCSFFCIKVNVFRASPMHH